MKIDRYTCEEAFRRLNNYVDRELSPREMELVEEHLRICAVCASEYAFETSVLKEVKAKVKRVAAPPDLMSKVSRALSQALNETNNDNKK